MNVPYNSKPLIAVEFPGTVVDVKNFEKCFGGESELFSVFRNSSKRLELKFRPNDPYCKTAHGDRFNTTNLVIKVAKRVKKRRDGSLVGEPEFQIEILGVASTTYKLKSMMDFQLLPASCDTSTKEYKSMIPDLMPTEIHSHTWLNKEVDLFLLPLVFSRFDLPQNGYADMQSKTQKKMSKNLPPNTIAQNRKSRTVNTVLLSYESSVPIEEPRPEALERLNSIPLDHDLKKKLDDFFRERPIWTKVAIVNKLKVDTQRLKYLLPCCAYYFVNGPWRALWVRFGYDPRKDPSAKIYQVLDLRINANIPINDGQKSRRRQMYFKLPIKCTSAQSLHKPATIDTQNLLPSVKEAPEDDDFMRRFAYEYEPGELPTCRQNFYQLCDIHLDSVQDLIHQNDGKEEFCHEKDGWCIPGTLDKCRELVINDIIKTAKMIKSDVES